MSELPPGALKRLRIVARLVNVTVNGKPANVRTAAILRRVWTGELTGPEAVALARRIARIRRAYSPKWRKRP